MLETFGYGTNKEQSFCSPNLKKMWNYQFLDIFEYLSQLVHWISEIMES